MGTQWPTFNIADITITIGIVLLLIDGYRQGREEQAREAAKAEPSSDAETAGA